MFLIASAILFKGQGNLPGDLHPGGKFCLRVVCLQGVYIQGGLGRPSGTGKVGGTHPTGMRSCFLYTFVEVSWNGTNSFNTLLEMNEKSVLEISEWIKLHLCQVF